jgi:hypothetical protein
VGRPGLEPGTYGLKVHSSAIELAARVRKGTFRPPSRGDPSARYGVFPAQRVLEGMHGRSVPTFRGSRRNLSRSLESSRSDHRAIGERPAGPSDRRRRHSTRRYVPNSIVRHSPHLVSSE